MVELSVIIPCYKSASSLPVLVGHLSALFVGMNLEYQVILVNDASPDHTWSVIKTLAEKNHNVVGISLAKNAGQEAATLCGLANSNGRFCLTMDDDLQHTAEGVMKLYTAIKANDSIDVVIASFPDKQHNRIRNLFTLTQKLIRNSTFREAKNLQFTSFRILRKEIKDRMVEMNYRFPKIGLMALMLTKNIMNIPVQHFKRPTGKSSYSASKLFRAFINFIFYYTMLPFKAILVVGILFWLFALFILFISVFENEPENALLLFLIAFSVGSILIALAFVVQYLAFITNHQKGGTRYFIEEIIGTTSPLNLLR
jgi:glycosyltransferase involved in cell wall biosynthesis